MRKLIFLTALFSLAFGTSALAQTHDPFNLRCITEPSLAYSLALKGVACMYEMMSVTSSSIVAPIASFMVPIAAAVIVLAFTFFGLRMMLSGVRSPAGEMVILVMKAGFVLLLLAALTSPTNPLNIGKMAFGIQQQLIDWGNVAFDSVTTNGTTGILAECRRMQDPAAGAPAIPSAVRYTGSNGAIVTLENVRLWASVDCLVGMLIGTVRGIALSITLHALLIAAFFSGAMGITFFFGVVMTFFSLIVMVVRSVFYLMHAYLAIAVIIMFVPLVIPLIMFKRTGDYFTRWVFMYIGIVFQPLILIVFLGLATTMIPLFITGNPTGCTSGNPTPCATRFGSNRVEIYSMWQLLGFDRVRDEADREKLIASMIKPDAKTLFEFLGTRPGDDLKEITAKQIAKGAIYSVGVLVQGAQKAKQVFVGNAEDAWRSSTNPFEALFNPLTVAAIDLGPQSQYVRFITSEEFRQKYSTFSYPEYDDQGQPTGKYFGKFPWYSGDIETDTNFQNWWFIKMGGAILCTCFMIYIFFSLSDSIPDMARYITGSAGIVISGGMTNIVQNDTLSHPKYVGGDQSSVPMADTIERFMGNVGQRWAQRNPSTGFNPLSRGFDFISSGFKSLGGELADNAKDTPLGKLYQKVRGDE